jgi:muramidase (phage lysozyme)
MFKRFTNLVKDQNLPLLIVGGAIVAVGGLYGYAVYQNSIETTIDDPQSDSQSIPPLVMKGGDPYIRALMRMISTSEANDPQPYSLIYGGSRADKLDKHPNKCVTINAGPNKGNCSTAAGRYQTINTTWYDIAKRYKGKQICFMWKCQYSFAPLEQDKVVHAWLSDRKFWGMDISQELQAGRIAAVRKKLSPTWTSLGYGIETNIQTNKLDQNFARIIEEERKYPPQPIQN